MKVLFLCKKFPYPLKDGESIAVSNLCRELKSLGCEITLLCMNTSKHYVDPKALPPAYNFFKAIHTIDVDNALTPWKAIASLVAGQSYHISRFNSNLFRAKLTEILQAEEFDIIQLETLYLAPYVDTIRKFSNARIVMRAHNVEHEIWERITENTGLHPKKWYLKYLARKLRKYEIEQFQAYDYLVTLTERDLKIFKERGYINGASAAPIGFDPSRYPSAPLEFKKTNLSLCFIGSLDWMPNLEGLNWFLSNCWPSINSRWPQITLHIAGRNTPMSLMKLKLPNVVVHGEVEDAAGFISRHQIMIVPLFSGSGMRVKIVEGMVMGKVIITTSLGKEGINGSHKEDFLIADSAPEFINAIDYCIQFPTEASKIAKQARMKAGAQFDGQQAAKHILDVYNNLMSYEKGSKSNSSAVSLPV